MNREPAEYAEHSPFRPKYPHKWGLIAAERKSTFTSSKPGIKVQIGDQICFQPDLQYVVHPGGTDVPLKNATAGFLRLGLEF